MIKNGIEYVKCNECNRTVMKFEMTDDCRMCKDCYIKWLEGQFKEQKEQIKKMRCCSNCISEGSETCLHCKNKELWQLKD